MVGFGILINKNDANRLGGEIGALRSDFAALRSDLYTEFKQMREQFHADIDKLTVQAITYASESAVTRTRARDFELRRADPMVAVPKGS